MEFKLPEKFDEFAEARQNGFMKVKGFKEDGKTVVGTFCTFTPVEVIDATGAICVSLCGSSNDPIVDAERDLPKNLCPLIKSSYGFAITDACPYTYFADLIVGETTCDGKKKMYEHLGKIKDVHVMELPQSTRRSYASDVWEKEGDILKEKMEELTGVTITDQMLRESAKERNEYRRKLIEMMEMQKLQPPPVNGKDFANILNGLQFEFTHADRMGKVQGVIDQAMDRYNKGERPVDEDAKRILVTGCPMHGVIDKTMGIIDEEGGVVVCQENCIGIKHMYQMIDEKADNIMRAITDRYLKIGCSVMTPNAVRMDLIKELAEEYQIDGVVDIVLQACHTYNVETKDVKSICDEMGIPYIAIETDFSQSDAGQLKTRLGAFIEMI